MPDPNKGKGKSFDDSLNELDSSFKTNAPASMASRVLSSAKTLSKGVASPSRSALAAQLASSSANSEKLASWPEIPPGFSTLQDDRLSINSSPNDHRKQHIEASLRTTTDRSQVAREMEHFTENRPCYSGSIIDEAIRMPLHWPRHDYSDEYSASSNQSRQKLNDNSARLLYVANANRLSTNTVQGGNEELKLWCLPDNDGAEVRSLLSDPGFVAATDIYDLDEPNPQTYEILFPEIEFSRRTWINSQIGARTTHQSMSADCLNNLHATFDLDLGDMGLPLNCFNEPKSSIQELGQQSPNSKQWLAVLETYTDDVWANFLPFVKEARNQLACSQDDPNCLDPRTLSRLRMIMGHLGLSSKLTGLNVAF